MVGLVLFLKVNESMLCIIRFAVPVICIHHISVYRNVAMELLQESLDAIIWIMVSPCLLSQRKIKLASSKV